MCIATSATTTAPIHGRSCTPTCASGASIRTRRRCSPTRTYTYSRTKSCVRERRPSVPHENHWLHLPWSAKARHSPLHRQDLTPCQTGYLRYQRVRPMYSQQQSCSNSQIQQRAREARCQLRHRWLALRRPHQVPCQVSSRPQTAHRARQARCQVRLRRPRVRGARQERCHGFLSQKNHQQGTPS